MPRTAIVAGVGPGLGASLARKFADEGCSLGLFARSGEYVESLAADLPMPVMGVEVDVTDPDAVTRGFERVRDELGPIEILVNHASGATWKGLQDCSSDEFEHAWRVAAYGGFLCSKEALSDMLDNGGTILFTGATSSVRGRGGAVGFSSAKFAVRGLAESMARELGPKGIHVAHVVIDGGILPSETDVDSTEDYLDPDAIAESYWHLVEQDKSAWTLELDVRPHAEGF
ncbi:SDR family NAD(P)-dependent oxidoreductase [Haladaptatus caseinilyticus]|uniref:SDR family NAD(P)-dependent oxidoreductase n=1 Tax=Haladaptatus caseinilyticus TaxID=2993314 RepID=UPI00224AD321|nr:SDR family NAD(P)-dependent oxidoreductase [Haladaptatus caseinilyticus]